MNHEGFNIVEPVGDMTIEVGDMFVGANVKQLFDSIGAGYFDSLLVDVLQSARDYADKIYVHLRDEYEWLCSEEYITELCDANEYLFDASGRFI
jgi:hypothetical protein